MKNITYKSLLKYTFCFVLFLIANKVLPNVPLSLALLPAFLSLNFSLFLTPLLFVCSLFFSFLLPSVFAGILSGIFFALVFGVYRVKKSKIKGELIVYVAVSLLPYFLFDFSGNLYVKLAYSAIIYAFAIIFTIFLKALFINKFARKNKPHQNLAICISVIILSIGGLEITGIAFYKFLAVTCALFFVGFYKNSKAFIPAFILPLALALYTKDLYYLAVFEIYCACGLAFISLGKLPSCVAVVVAQFATAYFSGEIGAFVVSDYLLTFAPAVIFLFTPNLLYKKLKEKITRFDEPTLTREILNAERAEISLKLSELSAVFSELENCLLCFDDLFLTKEQLTKKIAEEVSVSVCTNCSFYMQCIKKNKPSSDDLLKLVSVGISKGKVSLIDLSKGFSSYCYSTNNMIFEINKLIDEYAQKTQNSEQIKKYKGLVQTQASGISELLKSLAFDLGCRIDFKKEKEHVIFEALTTNGFLPRQIICAGDKYHLLFGSENIIYSKVSAILSACLGQNLSLDNKIEVNGGVLAVFSPAPLCDACFGVAQMPKHGQEISGDCHLLTKIDNGKFIVALCDGMGSGKNAFNNSKLAISLFENFYKAGLGNKNSLDLANKMLSACSEDSFATLDCAIFDLYESKCEIIKIGASYGFLLTQNGVKIIENTSLPLGILEEINPNFFTAEISCGDMLIIASDGITDCFFSSTDTVDFLLRERCKNPQTMANKLLSYALEQSDGEAKDDMTVIVVKVFSANQK